MYCGHMNKKKVFTTSQTAKLLNVSKETVINWINKKKLNAYETYGKHFRVHLEDIILFAKDNNISVNIVNTKLPDQYFLLVDSNRSVSDFIEEFVKVYFPEFCLIKVSDHISACIKIAEYDPHICFFDENITSDLDFFMETFVKNTSDRRISSIFFRNSEDNIEHSNIKFCIKKPIKDRILFKVMHNIINS